jgi:hypothetical protein
LFDKPLDRLKFGDVKAFLEQQIPEGTKLDYKEQITRDLPETACAFANTAGGYIIVGVGEVDREDLPDPNNVPGLDPHKKPRSSVINRITSSTRPTIVPDVSAPIQVDDGSGRVVLVVYVGESLDAPHEVTGASPKIPVRRSNKNEAAGLNDIERLINRRNEASATLRQGAHIEYFDSQIADLGGEYPPAVAAMVARPYRAPSFGFDLDADLDEKLKRIANEHDLGPVPDNVDPTPYGLAMDFKIGMPWEKEQVNRRVEVHEDGLIRIATALLRSDPEQILTPRGEVPEWGVGLPEIVKTFVGMMRFAARAYDLKRPGVEVEVRFGLRRVQGHRLDLPGYLSTASGGREAKVPQGFNFVLERALLLKTRPGGLLDDEEGVALAVSRAVSRWFGVSIPDTDLRDYFASYPL